MKALRIAFLVVTLLPMMGGSCDEVARNHPISLEQEAFEFHQLMRNKRFSDASMYLKPELRDEFIDQWRRAETMLDIQELEVTRVQKAPDAEYAQVDARMTYVLTGSLSVKQHRLFELWKGKGKTWEIDAELRPPPEILPPDLGPPSDGKKPPTSENDFGGAQ